MKNRRLPGDDVTTFNNVYSHGGRGATWPNAEMAKYSSVAVGEIVAVEMRVNGHLFCPPVGMRKEPKR